MTRSHPDSLPKLCVLMLSLVLVFTPVATALAHETGRSQLEPTQIVRTPRGSEPEEAEEDARSQPLEAYTGPVYGYSVDYDPDVWSLDIEIQEGNVDGIRLVRESSTFTVWAWDAYGSDPLGCLEGEADYYSTGVDTINNWEPALASDGEPLRYESDTLAWGVYTLTYTNSRGVDTELVDYISCEPIPGQDAVLIVLLSATPEAYNTELDYALDVLDTLQFGDVESGTVPEPDEGNLTEIDTNLSGTEYVSPYYGFTAEIPLEWQILEESANGSEELLVLGNGTSIVTLWATSEYDGDLAGCIDFAADASGLNLQLDRDSSGGDFRGVYRNEAFANFIYEADGVEMMYFVNCQAIGDTGGFLILIHDVEYSLFTSERRFRSEIENSIVMP